ncbi:MAG TPA: glycosyl transferase, partial [Chloroflexi bacterium]|nr:glycosyl transferase [Chloroflexota bacterium]
TYQTEIIVVENGSHDRTFEVAQEYVQNYPQYRAIHLEARGKGLAVQAGMLQARGQYRFMCDADLSMPITEINRFLPPLLENGEIVIASREAPGSVRYNEPDYRHWGGRAINLLIRTLALPGLNDTQCGFKMFHADIAEDIFQRQTILNWSFDIEVLYIARLRGYRIFELPIPWYFNPETKLNPLKDAFHMLIDILTMHRNRLRGLYNK